MAKYRVWAQMITDCYIDIEAPNESAAFEYAEDADGGDFHFCDSFNSGEWEVGSSIEELDENTNVDAIIDKRKDE